MFVLLASNEIILNALRCRNKTSTIERKGYHYTFWSFNLYCEWMIILPLLKLEDKSIVPNYCHFVKRWKNLKCALYVLELTNILPSLELKVKWALFPFCIASQLTNILQFFFFLHLINSAVLKCTWFDFKVLNTFGISKYSSIPRAGSKVRVSCCCRDFHSVTNKVKFCTCFLATYIT